MNRNHEIDQELATPIRDHIVFPDVSEKQVLPSLYKNKMKSEILKQAKVASQDFIEKETVSAHKTTNKVALTLKGTKHSIRTGKLPCENVAKQSKLGISLGMTSSLKDIRSGKLKYMVESLQKCKIREDKLMSSNCLRTASLKKPISSKPLVDSGTEKR